MLTHKNTLKLMATLVLAGSVAACSLIPPLPDTGINAPQNWLNGQVNGKDGIPGHWWHSFGSDELDHLIGQSLAQNTDIAAALERVAQAQAAAGEAQAALVPGLDGTGSIGRTHTRPGGNSSRYNAEVDVSYELDLFGKNRAANTAAHQSLKASLYDQQAMQLTVTSQVAQTYFDLLALRARTALAAENVNINKGLLGVVKQRFISGATTALDYAQQQTALDNAQASLATLQNQQHITADALAVLLGLAPAQLQVSGADLAALKVPQVALLQPADLLTRRPDVAASEAQLKAANADVGVARANLFPSLSLGGSIGVSAAPISGPGAVAEGISASLLAPIFHAGSLHDAVALSKAKEGELVADYRKTVLTAFQEAEDALSAATTAQARAKALENASKHAAEAYKLAKQQYAAGTIDLTTLLNNQNSQINAEDGLIQARADMLSAAVGLYKAMGGGFKLGE